MILPVIVVRSLLGWGLGVRFETSLVDLKSTKKKQETTKVDPSTDPRRRDINNRPYNLAPMTKTIYGKSSDSYWNERRRRQGKKTLVIMVISTAVFTFVATSAGALVRRIKRARRPPPQRRNPDQTTEVDWKLCESRVNSQEECTTICLPERNSIQRKTMHQACLLGCQQAHAASTVIGCRGSVSSEEDVFREIGGLAHVHCSKFQVTDPKPDVFATCRKYHRAGAKDGFRMGSSALMHVLDEEFHERLKMVQEL
jgi:hypothetical protein